MRLVDVAIGSVDVVLNLIEFSALGVDHVLHILLHLQCIHHPALYLLYLFLLYLDHALIVKCLLVHLVHLYLNGLLTIALVVSLTAFWHPGFADL